MRRHQAFTLMELLVVIGMIVVLASLLVPVAAKARSAAQATTCLANLRQMGAAWTAYEAENHGALIPYMWNTPGNPTEAWNGYWPGILDTYAVRGNTLLCPAASEPILTDDKAPPATGDPSPPPARHGYGSATHAWTGRFASNGTAIRFSATIYRDGSYGFNRYLTAKGGFGPRGMATSVFAINSLCDVPVFMDCAYADVQPGNGSPGAPVPLELPPDLSGMQAVPGKPDLWKLLIARHGKAINVCMADGSVRRVPLSELYMLTWQTAWQKYQLPLP